MSASEPKQSVRVPGKVMLSGEYAVLLGATAALLPVPRYLELAAADAEPAGGYPPALAAARALAVPELAEHEQAHGVPQATADATQFYAAGVDGQQVKLGLGLSAAEAVGMLALRFAVAGLNWQARRERICELALIAHANAQGGSGSGADVAACAMGQAILYRLPSGAVPEAASMARPDTGGVPLALLWTGQPADTRTLVARFDAWVSGGGLSAGDMQVLVSAADELAPLWFGADTAALYSALDEFDAVLTRRLTAAGVSYRLPVHARIEQWARKHGGRAKPTGAGGGDMILLVGELPLQQLRGLVIEL